MFNNENEMNRNDQNGTPAYGTPTDGNAAAENNVQAEGPQWSDSTPEEAAAYTSQQYTDTTDGTANAGQSDGWTHPQQEYQRTQQEETQRRYSSYEFTQPEQDTDTSRKAKRKKRKNSSKKAHDQKSRGFARIAKGAVACICGGVLAGVAAYGGITLMNHVAGPAVIKEETAAAPTISTTQTASTTSGSGNGAYVYDVSAVAAEVMPSVVSIVNTGTQKVNTFWGVAEQDFTSSGSGVIIGSNDTELLIATNNHVVTDAETLEITFADETTAEAVVKGKSSDMDLAVVAVSLDTLEQSTLDSIKVATLGDSYELTVGEPAIAIGNALGYGQSVTSGIISALDREVTVETDSSYGFGDSQTITSKLIQTDAAINPGNSGGPLFNIKGEVIGINSVKYASSEVEGMGYAIPISEAQPILDDLMNRKTKTKVDESQSAYLGIKGADVTEQAQSVYGMPKGGYVVSVEEGSAAEKAGIKKGDIIVKLGDTEIDSMESLQNELQYYAAGETIDIVIARSESGEYAETTLQITPDKKPKTVDSDNTDTDTEK